MTITVTVEEAEHDFARLLERVKSGEDEIVIAEEGTPVARLVAPAVPQCRQPGSAKGQFVVPPEFFDPLPDDLLDEFYK